MSYTSNELRMNGKCFEYCLSLKFECCLQELDRQVPLMDEIDDKVFSTFLLVASFEVLYILLEQVGFLPWAIVIYTGF